MRGWRTAEDRAARGAALLALLAIAAVLVSTWIARTPPGTVFRTVVGGGVGSHSVSVALGDTTGLVTAIEPASAAGPPSVLPIVDGADAVVVTWGTQACDQATTFTFQSSADGYRLAFRIDHGGLFTYGCQGNLSDVQGMRIRFSQPVPVASIVIQGDGSPWP